MAASWFVAALAGLVLWGAKVGLARPLNPAVPLLSVAALALAGVLLSAELGHETGQVVGGLGGAVT